MGNNMKIAPRLLTLTAAVFVMCSVNIASAKDEASDARVTEERKLSLLITTKRSSDAAQVALLDQLLSTRLVKNGLSRHRHTPMFDPTALDDAVRLLATARQEMAKDHNLARAEAHEISYNRALLAFRGALGHANTADLAEAYIAMATTRLKNDDRRLASAYLSSAMFLRPQLAAGDFMGRSKTKDLFRELRSEWSGRKTGRLHIKTKRKGIEVYRNDELVGYTPLHLNTLPVGTHLIRLKKDGYYSTGQFVTVRAETTTDYIAELRPVPGRGSVDKALKLLLKSRWPKKRDKIQAAIQTVRRIFGVNDVVALQITRSRKGFQVTGAVGLQGAPAIKVKTVLAADSKLLTAVGTLVDGWFEASKPKPVPPVAPPEKDKTKGNITQPGNTPDKPKKSDGSKKDAAPGPIPKDAPDTESGATPETPKAEPEAPESEPEAPEVEPEAPDVEPE